MPYHYETLSKWLAHDQVILPEYEAIWNRIMDFLLFASFLASLIFFDTVSSSRIHSKVSCHLPQQIKEIWPMPFAGQPMFMNVRFLRLMPSHLITFYSLLCLSRNKDEAIKISPVADQHLCQTWLSSESRFLRQIFLCRFISFSTITYLQSWICFYYW